MDNAELCARVTLMPLDVIDVDAAIIFADMMTPVGGLGIEYDMVEGTGPLVADPITSKSQIEKLASIPAQEALPELFRAIKMVRGEVEGVVPVIGFAGAPFTLASYLIEGRPTRDFSKTKGLMRSEPGAWHALMERLVATIVDYLEQQVYAGAQVLQIFDSWVGELSVEEYAEFVMPHAGRIFAETASLEVPRIYFGTRTADLLPQMAETGPEVVGVDWRIPLNDAWDRIGRNRGIQGNLDPEILAGPRDTLVQTTNEILAQAGGEPGHIFNLGHGVLPHTPLENMQALVEAVHGRETQ